MPIHNRISITKLPHSYQRVIYLRDVERKRWREIAAQLKMCMSDAQRRYKIVQDQSQFLRYKESVNLSYGKEAMNLSNEKLRRIT